MSIEFFRLKSISKGFFCLIGALAATSGSLSGSIYPLPTPIGGPIFINPAITYPDPVLAGGNLPIVMDNWFQPPFYPGGTPDYLSQIYFLSNAFTGVQIVMNPLNDQIVHLTVGQNQIEDLTGTFYSVIIGTNTFATSNDGGETWSYGPPVEQTIPLGGTISQLVNASIGPGLFLEYTKEGNLFASGWGFFDLAANPPHSNPLSGFLTSFSEDEGVSWSTPQILWPSTSDAWFQRLPYANPAPSFTGSRLQEFYITIDPSNSDIIHAATTVLVVNPQGAARVSIRDAFLYYYRSEDGGKTFSAPVLAYSIADDPDLMGEFFDPSYGTDLNYFLWEGFAGLAGHPIVFDKNTILIPIMYTVVPQGVTDMAVFSKILYGVGMIRSTDGGKTWSKVLGRTDPAGVFSQNLVDPGWFNPDVPVLIEGYECFPYFGELTIGFSRSMGSTNLVSASTGRTYLIYSYWGGNNTLDFTGGSNLPQFKNSQGVFNVPVIAASADKGATWSPFVEVTKTPTDIITGARQSFSIGWAISQDGWLAVAYYDFRNWTGYPGEIYDNIDPETAPPLPTDAWLAIYRETSDPCGGSTGIGLDYVGEIRLTPESYNARIAPLSTAIPYITPFVTGTPERISMAFNNKNELFVLYSSQSPGSPDNITTNDYKGMTIDTNGYYNLYLQRFKFPKFSDQ